MKLGINRLLSVVAIGCILVSVPLAQSSALTLSSDTSIRIKIDKESFLNPDFLFLDIEVESATSTYNAVMSIIDYDPNIIQIENISFNNSFCSIVATSSIDNLTGETSIACGNPDANASSTSQIARLQVKKIQEGFVEIKLNNSQVLSNDGLANNILTNAETHNIMIIKEL